MMLADRIMAEPEREDWLGLPIGELKKLLRNAERFVFDLGAVKAAEEVSISRPSSLLSAIHLRRPPFPITWIEYPFKELMISMGEKVSGPQSEKPTPSRMGYLIERVTLPDIGPNTGGIMDVVTYVWGSDTGFMISPVASHLRPDGDAFEHEEAIRVSAGSKIAPLLRKAGLGEQAASRPLNADEVRRLVERKKTGWKNLSEDEITSVLRLQNYNTVGMSTCWISTVAYLVTRQADDPGFMPGLKQRLAMLWKDGLEDIEGEPPLMTAMLILLNSKNAVSVEKEDLSKLNKARAKSGKRLLLGRSLVKISLSKVQARRAYGSTNAPSEPKRLHLVRGHFKLKKHGVYWWNAHMRGDPAAGEVRRERYEVAA